MPRYQRQRQKWSDKRSRRAERPGRSQGTATAAPASKPEPAARPVVRWVRVDDDSAGQRLDNFLLAQLRGVPKSVIYRVIRKGEVRVNKGRVRPDTRLQGGDQVRIPPVATPEKTPRPAPGDRVQGVMEEAIVFEDDHLLVVNKPSGIAVHGGSGLDFGLIEVLRAARPQARFLELVHRLDRDTSGLVMVAKKRSALRFLQDELRQKAIRKDYHALVEGDWPAHLDRVDVSLQRFELPSGERRVKVDEAGKSSLTRFRVLSFFTGYTLVQASPITGRTHQIRVHAAFAGHPIAGDDKYMQGAGLKAFRALGGSRLMLHARALTFRHPETGVAVELEAAYDSAYRGILERLQARAG